MESFLTLNLLPVHHQIGIMGEPMNNQVEIKGANPGGNEGNSSPPLMRLEGTNI